MASTAVAPTALPPQAKGPRPRLTALELSNYNPKLTHDDITHLFHGFNIRANFELPVGNFSRPFRTTIWIEGHAEAERAVKELHGLVNHGRRISVQIKDRSSYEEREAVVDELADGMKVAAINTARIYFASLNTRILEVRELVKGRDYMAFLQARDPVTVTSGPGAHFNPGMNRAEWSLVSSGSASLGGGGGKEFDARLEALKELQRGLEEQGRMQRVWEGENISWELDADGAF